MQYDVAMVTYAHYLYRPPAHEEQEDEVEEEGAVGGVEIDASELKRQELELN